MCVIAYVTLKQNKEQLDEIKRQWNEERRPRLGFSVIIFQQAFYLKIKNYGQQDAYNIRILFNNDFLDNLPKESYANLYRETEKKPFFIERGESKYLLIGFCQTISEEWNGKNVVLKIDGEYCDKYIIDEILQMEEYISKRFMSVSNELTAIISNINHGLVSPGSGHYTIQESIEIIAKYIKNNVSETNGNNGVEIPS